MKLLISRRKTSSSFAIVGVASLVMMCMTSTATVADDYSTKLETNNMGTFLEQINNIKGSGPIGYDALISNNDMNRFGQELAEQQRKADKSGQGINYDMNLQTNNMDTFVKAVSAMKQK